MIFVISIVNQKTLKCETKQMIIDNVFPPVS